MRETDRSDLPEFCQRSTLVLGCGNILFGDDGFGCAFVEHVLSHERVPEDVCMIDAGTSVRKILFTLCLSPVRPRRLLIADAFDAGQPIGEIFEIDPAAIPAVKLDDFSMHQMPTSNLLRELQEACGVEVRVLACQTGELPAEISPGLSAPVQAALPRATDWFLHEYLLPNERRTRSLNQVLVACPKDVAQLSVPHEIINRGTYLWRVRE